MILRRLLLHGRAGQKSPKTFFRVFFESLLLFRSKNKKANDGPIPIPTYLQSQIDPSLLHNGYLFDRAQAQQRWQVKAFLSL